MLRKGCINPKSICATCRTARAQALTRGQKRVFLVQIGSERVKIGSEMVKIRPKMVKIDQIRRMCQNVPECGGMCTYVHICGGMSNLVLAQTKTRTSTR